MTTDPLEGTGLTDQGYVAPREDEFKEHIRNEYEEATGESPDWEETEFLGAITAAAAKVCAEMAEQLQSLYEARDPRQASGIHLESIAELTGIRRRPATRGIALIELIGQLGTVVPAGKEVLGGGPDGRAMWRLPESVAIGYIIELGSVTDGQTYEVSTTETVDVTAGSSDDVDSVLRELAEKVATLPGITDATAIDADQDGKAQLIDARVDPTDSPTLGLNDPPADIFTKRIGAVSIVEAKQAGEILAPDGTIDEIATPVMGWERITHRTTIPGNDIETDEQLRARRQLSMAAAGAGSVASIRANLLQLDFIESAFVDENTSSSPDTIAGESVPPHSFLTVLWPATFTAEQQKQIAETLWRVKPTGIPAEGSDYSATINTEDGAEHDVAWSVASQVNVDVEIDVTLGLGVEKYEVETPITHATQKYFNDTGVGERVRRSKLFARLDDIEGIESIREIRLAESGQSLQTDDFVPEEFEVPNLPNPPSLNAI